jgi:hypothetical protein
LVVKLCVKLDCFSNFGPNLTFVIDILHNVVKNAKAT